VVLEPTKSSLRPTRPRLCLACIREPSRLIYESRTLAYTRIDCGDDRVQLYRLVVVLLRNYQGVDPKVDGLGVVVVGIYMHYRKTQFFRRPILFPTVPRVPSEIALFPTAHGQPTEITLFPTAQVVAVGNRWRPLTAVTRAAPRPHTHTTHTRTHAYSAAAAPLQEPPPGLPPPPPGRGSPEAPSLGAARAAARTSPPPGLPAAAARPGLARAAAARGCQSRRADVLARRLPLPLELPAAAGRGSPQPPPPPGPVAPARTSPRDACRCPSSRPCPVCPPPPPGPVVPARRLPLRHPSQVCAPIT
jgi:hypothetical protein